MGRSGEWGGAAREGEKNTSLQKCARLRYPRGVLIAKLDYLRTFGSDEEQAAADVCEVTVPAKPGPHYLTAFASGACSWRRQ